MSSESNTSEELADLTDYVDEVVERVDTIEEKLEDIDFDAEISELKDSIEEKFASLRLQQGPKGDSIQGPSGPIGPPGRPGPRGFAGQTPTKAEIKALIPAPIPGRPGKDGTSVKLKEVVDEIRPDILKLIPQGGNMNRNIAVGGNTSVLSRYTDINIKAGSNVTLTYANNNNTKYLDLTIASSGGGGSVIGTTRSINTIATSQTAGATSGTDYVYICSAGVQLTLPDAVANTNLYTVKNTSTSSVLVSTTAAETIDTSTNLILATQFTSVDLISDGANWEIT